MYIHAILGDFAQWNELVALCDLSQTRMDWYNQQIQARSGKGPLPTYHANDFDRMIAETKPDVVIVTTMDATHHQYICRAMELGCDAITEKPMTTDDAKARQIFETIEKTGRSLRVTFNYRYAPLATAARELIMQGVVGRPRHVDFSWVLDTRHGADYFRRWHREKDKSGGLLVHKATHHFDLINWWIDSIPPDRLRPGRSTILRPRKRRRPRRNLQLRPLHRRGGGRQRSLRPEPRFRRDPPEPLPERRGR